MDDYSFDFLTRSLNAPRTRRRATWSGMAGMVTIAFGATAHSSDAANKKGRKRKKCRQESPPSCAEVCSSSCNLCVHRKVDSVLCSAGVSGVAPCGEPCFSDNDCVNTPFPYCVTRTENRQSGLVLDLACNGVLGRCAAMFPCVV